MTTVKVYLAEGFSDDHVVLRVDGRKVLDEDGVTTAKLYGLAREIDPVTVAGSQARIEIELPRKNVKASITADLSKGDQVPISIEGDHVTHFVGKHIGFG